MSISKFSLRIGYGSRWDDQTHNIIDGKSNTSSFSSFSAVSQAPSSTSSIHTYGFCFQFRHDNFRQTILSHVVSNKHNSTDCGEFNKALIGYMDDKVYTHRCSTT